jgi:hypothetical protein
MKLHSLAAFFLNTYQDIIEYQESSWKGGGVKCGDQRFRLTTSLPSVCRLSRKCGNLDISLLNGPPWPVTGDQGTINFFLCCVGTYEPFFLLSFPYLLTFIKYVSQI